MDENVCEAIQVCVESLGYSISSNSQGLPNSQNDSNDWDWGDVALEVPEFLVNVIDIALIGGALATTKAAPASGFLWMTVAFFNQQRDEMLGSWDAIKEMKAYIDNYDTSTSEDAQTVLERYEYRFTEILEGVHEDLVLGVVQDPILRSLLETSWRASSYSDEGQFFEAVGSSPEILEELVGSPALAMVLSQLLGSDNVQGLLAEQFFTTTGGEEGGDILFDQAVEAAVNRALGVEEDAFDPYLFGSPVSEDMDYDTWELEMGEARDAAANPLQQMREEIQTLKTGMTSIDDLKARISTLASAVNQVVNLGNEISALRGELDKVKAIAGTCSCNSESTAGEDPELDRDLINGNYSGG